LMATNPALQQMLGYDEQELAGSYFFDFLDGAEEDGRTLLQTLLTGRRREYTQELVYLPKDGEVGEANLTMSLLQRDSDASPLLLALVEDITERKQTREILIEAERLTAMGRMGASLAHEINNPLQSVIGCLGLAMEAREASEDTTYLMDVALQELKRAANIVRRMRDLSRPGEGEKKLGSVHELVEKVVALTRKQAENHRVEVIWEGADGLPSVPVVRERIQQVFLNLVLNAIDAMPEGGELLIQGTRTEETAGVEISFTDTGVGIAPEESEGLFEAFRSNKDQGLGLGLYVSRSIVQEHGGRIEVDSEAGHGATFTVWLPGEEGAGRS
jgi:two-component system NtrC family sensor kinase